MLSFPWWLSLLVGFLSLSEEILWVRIIGFGYRTLPPAFAFVLACYLVGIAVGAVYGKRLCARVRDLYGAAALILGVSALFDVSLPLLIVRLVSTDLSDLGGPALLIATTAALKSILFPIAHHLGAVAEGPRVGRTVSRIYLGNIIGATLGPLVTGLIALEYLNTDQCFALAGAACLLIAIVCVLKSGRWQLLGATLSAAVASSAIAMHTAVPGAGSLARLAFGGNFRAAMSHFIANRYGVIHTVRTTVGDKVFGGNVYDGVAAADVDRNPNSLERLYMLALLHPDSRRALAIGLSTGAWVRCLEGFPSIQHIDVVEINPGYLELIKQYPPLAPLLADPRVHVHIDDGRRWLKRNPGERYDLIVQNTTFHWRANTGNLLSREYFSEVKRHLSAGGVVTMNTTGSFDVLATAQAVFAHAYRYENFLYASDHALTPEVLRLSDIRRPDGTAFVIDGHAGPFSVVALLANAKLEPVESFLARRSADAHIITDDNLLTEYRDGQRFGPQFVRALLPSEPQHFDLGDP